MSRSGGPPGGPPRPENMPPRLRGLPPGHRPSRSQEEAMRARRPGGGRPGGVQFDPTSPQRRAEQQQRPRRNSDSSLVDSDKPLTDEEKKAREARRKDRERRAREAAKAKPVNKKLDIIDQLDATSIFGTGRELSHVSCVKCETLCFVVPRADSIRNSLPPRRSL